MPNSDPNNKAPIADWLKEHVPNLRSSRLIEIGPGSGDIGRVMADACPSARREAVEIFAPYVEQYKLRDVYDEVLVADFCDLPDSFFRGADAVLWIDGPEHLEAEAGAAQLDRLANLTRQGVVANTPRYQYPQDAVDGNAAMRHLSTWDLARWTSLSDITIELWRGEVTHMWWHRPNGRSGKRLTVAYIVGEGEAEDGLFDVSLRQSAKIANEIVIVDSSKGEAIEDVVDQETRDTLRGYFSRRWTGSFSEARNFALDQATGDWVLFVDADELLPDELIADWPDCAKACFLAYDLPRYHFIRSGSGGTIGVHKADGWYPDAQRRLLRNDRRIRYQGKVHEQPRLFRDGVAQPWPTGSIGQLPHHLHHYAWVRDEAMMLAKIASRMEQEVAEGFRKPGVWDPTAVLHNEVWGNWEPFDGRHPALFDEGALCRVPRKIVQAEGGRTTVATSS